MAPLKERDFVEVEYTGKLKENNAIFDTTDEKLAKKHELHNPEFTYGPVIICIGEQQIIPGLDRALVGKELGKFSVELAPDEGFGKKDGKLIKLVPMGVFKKNKIPPMPGLSINIDGTVGVVKTVSGGRVLVDFNHPLSSKELVYDVKVNRVVTDPKEKIKAYFKSSLKQDAEVEINDNVATVSLGFEFPIQLREQFEKRVAEVTGQEKIVLKKKESK